MAYFTGTVSGGATLVTNFSNSDVMVLNLDFREDVILAGIANRAHQQDWRNEWAAYSRHSNGCGLLED